MNNLDNSFLGTLTGCDFNRTDSVKMAVAARIKQLKIAGELVERYGDHCYDGNRCLPENLGWRFKQNVVLSRMKPANGARIGPEELAGKELSEPTPEKIMAGEFDTALIATWHDAAACEYYYRYEKEW